MKLINRDYHYNKIQTCVSAFIMVKKTQREGQRWLGRRRVWEHELDILGIVFFFLTSKNEFHKKEK
jgi:hypothetical protein